MKRYKYGYATDDWGLNPHMTLIEEEDGPVVRWEDSQRAIEEAKRSSPRPMYWVSAGKIDAEVFAERLGCSQVAEDFMKEVPPGPMWGAANAISARILGRSGKVSLLHPQLPEVHAKNTISTGPDGAKEVSKEIQNLIKNWNGQYSVKTTMETAMADIAKADKENSDRQLEAIAATIRRHYGY